MPYDPRMPLTEHSLADVEKVWGDRAIPGAAQKLFKENRPLHDSLRKAAEVYKLLGPSSYGTPAPNTPYKPPTRTYTSAELAARGQFTESYCRELFSSGSAKAARELYETDREGYEDAKDSAIAYGILPARSTPRPAPAPVATPEPLHRVSDLLCDESHIPRGSELPWEQVQQLVAQKVQRDRQAQADADAKVAADRAAELEKLTAAEKLEQAARDQKQRDLDRLAELIAPKPVVVPEPIALATARVIAQEKEKAVEVPIT